MSGGLVWRDMSKFFRWIGRSRSHENAPKSHLKFSFVLSHGMPVIQREFASVVTYDPDREVGRILSRCIEGVNYHSVCFNGFDLFEFLWLRYIRTLSVERLFVNLLVTGIGYNKCSPIKYGLCRFWFGWFRLGFGLITWLSWLNLRPLVGTYHSGHF